MQAGENRESLSAEEIAEYKLALRFMSGDPLFPAMGGLDSLIPYKIIKICNVIRFFDETGLLAFS